jgi:hypothetical protein
MALQAALVRPPIYGLFGSPNLVKRRHGPKTSLRVESWEGNTLDLSPNSMKRNLPGYYNHMRRAGNRIIDPVGLMAPTFTNWADFQAADAAVQWNMATAENHHLTRRGIRTGYWQRPTQGINPIEVSYQDHLYFMSQGQWFDAECAMDEAITILEEVSKMSLGPNGFSMSQDALLEMSITVSNIISKIFDLVVYNAPNELYLFRVLRAIYHASKFNSWNQDVTYLVNSLRQRERQKLLNYVYFSLYIQGGDIFGIELVRYMVDDLGMTPQ